LTAATKEAGHVELLVVQSSSLLLQG
jgi:hypothetical protein